MGIRATPIEPAEKTEMNRFRASDCRLVIVNACLVLCALSFDARFCVADEGLREVIGRLAENENLYENLDVKWEEEYSLKEFFAHNENDVPQSDILEGHSVEQDGLFKLLVQGEIVGPLSKPDVTKRYFLKGFDGEATRVLVWNRSYVGKVFTGPKYGGGDPLFCPHTLSLRSFSELPLSVYCSGKEAIAAHPKVTKVVMQSTGWNLRSRLDGREMIDGMLCDKVTVERIKNEKGEVGGQRVLWLDIERNMLPIRVHAFNFTYSKDQPTHECHLEDLRELEPGVWFPFKATVSGYDDVSLLEQKKSVLLWTREYVVKSASLKPDYETEFFSDVIFPEGTQVHKVNGE